MHLSRGPLSNEHSVAVDTPSTHILVSKYNSQPQENPLLQEMADTKAGDGKGQD